MVTPVYQLNTPHCTVTPGRTCGSGDCVVCCIIMGADFATEGKVVINQEQIRKLPTIPDHGGLTLTDIRDAYKGLSGKFTAKGFESPIVTVYDSKPWQGLLDNLRTKRLWIIAFLDQPRWNQICVNNNRPDLSGDLEFTGTHAVGLTNLKWSTESASGTSTVRIFNPLWDGRRDQPTGTRVKKGPSTVPLWWVREAMFERAGENKADYATVSKAEKFAEPPVDDCDRPTKATRKDGKSSEGAI